jgi:hypothetical protein
VAILGRINVIPDTILAVLIAELSDDTSKREHDPDK